MPAGSGRVKRTGLVRQTKASGLWRRQGGRGRALQAGGVRSVGCRARSLRRRPHVCARFTTFHSTGAMEAAFDVLDAAPVPISALLGGFGAVSRAPTSEDGLSKGAGAASQAVTMLSRASGQSVCGCARLCESFGTCLISGGWVVLTADCAAVPEWLRRDAMIF